MSLTNTSGLLEAKQGELDHRQCYACKLLGIVQVQAVKLVRCRRVDGGIPFARPHDRPVPQRSEDGKPPWEIRELHSRRSVIIRPVGLTNVGIKPARGLRLRRSRTATGYHRQGTDREDLVNVLDLGLVGECQFE